MSILWTAKAAFALFVGAAATLFAQGPRPGPVPPAGRPGQGRPGGGGGFLISRPVPDPAAVERGKAIFSPNCGFCHGANANGGEGGADLIRSPLALRDENGETIGPVILKGVPEKGMPAFARMSAEQIKDIAAFLRARQQAAINRSAYTLLEINTGDPKKGEEVFAGNCAGCHSPTGNLAHIATKYEASVLMGRILYPGGRGGRRARGPATSPAARPQVTVTTRTGESFTGTQEYLDDFNVSLRDASGAYYSFERQDGLKLEVRDPLAGHVQLLKKFTDADLHNVLAYLETLK